MNVIVHKLQEHSTSIESLANSAKVISQGSNDLEIIRHINLTNYRTLLYYIYTHQSIMNGQHWEQRKSSVSKELASSIWDHACPIVLVIDPSINEHKNKYILLIYSVYLANPGRCHCLICRDCTPSAHLYIILNDNATALEFWFLESIIQGTI